MKSTLIRLMKSTCVVSTNYTVDEIHMCIKYAINYMVDATHMYIMVV